MACDGLTDVYYDGSLAQWKSVSVGRENECLLNATLHLNETESQGLVFTSYGNGTCYFSLSDKTREDIRFTAAGVRFGYVNHIYFKLKAANLADVTLIVNGKTYTADDLSLAENTADTYILYTDPIYATEFDKVFSVELAVDGDEIQMLTYSVKSYVFDKQNIENNKMAALAKALYNYGRSAVAYKNTQ
jgi:hypothetical protein